MAGCDADSQSRGPHAVVPGPSGSAQPQHHSIRWSPNSVDPGRFAVEVAGLNAAQLRAISEASDIQWPRFFSVYAGQGDTGTDASVPPMLGRYSIRDGLLLFEPRFPLEPGIRYRAVFGPGQTPGGSPQQIDSIHSVFELPLSATEPSTVVSQVYPTASELPENLLKFYIYFSAPMSGGRIYEHIELLNDTGAPVELPFLEIDEELWNPAMTRLTLFIDPGRIKRGVLPLEEVGPALESGKNYTLVIHNAWKDAKGDPLRVSYRKSFYVGPPDRELADPTRWDVQAPPASTRVPLEIRFHEPVDHALAQRLIVVISQSGQALTGTVHLADHERRWMFIPAEPWKPGAHTLVIQTTLEDLAGNNIGKPFEVDLFESVQRRATNASVTLAFEVR